MSKKIILIIVAVVSVAVLAVVLKGFREEKPEFSTEKVSYGTVFQTVSETGVVRADEEVKLGFKGSGRVADIYVKVGDKVESGQNLAKLDTAQLNIQLTQARAALDIAKSQLAKLLSGASKEEVRVSEAALANAEIALDNARQNLEDVQATAQNSLDSTYEDALGAVDDAYLKSYNAYNAADYVYKTYFKYADQESASFKENKDKIKIESDKINLDLGLAKNNATQGNIDTAVATAKKSLGEISGYLASLRDLCEKPNYQNAVSAADKASLDTQRTYIITSYTNVANYQQAISAAKAANDYNINVAKAGVSSAEGALRAAQDNLALLKAPARQEDVSLYQAQVKQAEANVFLLEDQARESVLRSPVAGQITAINKEKGEMFQLTETMISLLPASPFQVKVDIYEEDIVKLEINDVVDITLAPFPDKVFSGKVMSIDPAEKLVGGVVYYEVAISLDNVGEKVKPGMSADVVINTDKKENVLVIPGNAVTKKDGKTLVKVLTGNIAEEREIEVGLRGDDDIVEVISGLSEGEEVVIE